jgi:phosphate transport system protein
LFLISHVPVKPLVDIPRLAGETTRSLSDSITAFLNEDASLAQEVCERDHIIDALQVQIFRELVTFMSSGPGDDREVAAPIRSRTTSSASPIFPRTSART